VADSGYASLQLLANCRRFLPKPVTFITRLRLDAALYNPALSRRAGQMDRPGLKCERLPNPTVVAEDPSTAWVSATVDDWYRSGEHTGKVASATAVWYSIGLPAVPKRCVLVREPQGAFAAQALPLVTLLAHQRIARNGGLLGTRLSTVNPTQPSPMHSYRCARSCGATRLFASRPQESDW
jgi:hypothetical protein